MLKGGFALQLRYGLHARSTKDVDLRTTGDPWSALHRLRHAIAASTKVDPFAFEFGDVVEEMPAAPGGSLRVRVIALLAGVEFAAFHLDISSGDALVDPPDILSGSTLLQFAGIAPVEIPVYPVTQHLAEKLHAYTLPRSAENTRVKDMVDLVVVAATETIEADRLSSSVKATFEVRGTHPIPDRLPDPPTTWERPFAKTAIEIIDIVTTRLHEGIALSRQFWDPFLANEADGLVWLPCRRRWNSLRESR